MILLSANCDNSVNPPGSHNRNLLSEIRINGLKDKEFEYDSSNRLVSLKSFYNDTCTYTESYEYDSIYRLSKRLYTGFIETYQYTNNGTLLSTTKEFPATSKTWLETYQYNGEGRISGATTFFNGDTSGYIQYKYDNKGNTIERTEFSKDNTLMFQEKCTFDSCSNPLQLTFPFDMVKRSNIVQYYYYAIYMSAPPINYTSSYQYDSSGLPIKEVRHMTVAGDSIVYNYVYSEVYE
jgi:hypothetical protein